VPLIEHVIARAKAGGASEFVVVTGYRGERVEHFLGRLASSSGLRIDTVRNARWEEPNGISVLAAEEHLSGKFLLMMADHLFDPAIPAMLLEQEPGGAALTLAIDYRVHSPLIDLDDATKVKVGNDGRIVSLGKTIDCYDAIDTGVFLAHPTLLTAIRRIVKAGAKGSLSEGVQALADDGRAHTLDVGESWWLDVDDPRAHELAEQQLASFAPAR
jgi:choline kinase